MTNPGLPPALQRTHRQVVEERTRALKVDLDDLLAAVDAALNDEDPAITAAKLLHPSRAA